MALTKPTRPVRSAERGLPLSEDCPSSCHDPKPERSYLVQVRTKDGKPLDVIAKQTGHRSLTTLIGYIRRAVELNDDSPTAGLL